MSVSDPRTRERHRLSYWIAQLRDAPRLLELPTDWPRRTTEGSGRCVWSMTLPPDLQERLQALTHRTDSGIFVILLAVCQVLLHRYSGEDHILVGSRTVPGSDLSANSPGRHELLVLRTDCSGDPRFRDLLARVEAVVAGAAAHAVPFDRVLAELGVDSDPGRHPLVQVGLDYGDITSFESPPLDLELAFAAGPGGLSVSVEYDSHLFGPGTISRMAGHLQALLAGVTDDPEQHLSALPLLTSDERQQLLVDWNQTQSRFPADRCLHELFEDRCRAAPGHTAVVSAEASLSYAELNSRSNQLAHHLRSEGVGPEQLVGLCVRRSLDTVVGLLGILKAGAAYLPLDPAYPTERLALMIEDSMVPVLVTQEALVEKFPEYAGRLIRLDAEADAEAIAGEPTRDPPALATSANLCYAIYTSGSAGRPKGVLLDHLGRVNNFTDFNQRFSIGPNDRLLAVSSLSFDMSAYDVLGSLAAGGSIVLPRASDERDPAHWADLMSRHRVTIWHSAPAMLQMLVDHVAERPELWPRDLRLVLLGGDWIPVDLPDRLRALVSGVEIVSLGGATEASMDSTIYSIDKTDDSWTSIPYGRPMANQIAHVLDRALEPVPIGVPGELYLGGVGLARGYLNRPELTAERFVPSPFVRTPGERLYRTGDLARYQPDGNLELLGRLDQQVKIRGNRVELGEVAAALRAHPLVDQVAVVASDNRFDKTLVAYAVPTLEEEDGDSGALDLDAEQVTQWQAIYDETYRGESDQSDPKLNLIGWQSSYTGLPIAEEEMREWVETTVERVLGLEPARVLEIGCGTGLLLFRIAPTCTAYCGTDFSTVALDGVQRHLDAPDVTLPQVSLSCRDATDFRGFEPHSFDTVILNSITQIFPSIEYLLKVLEGATTLVAPGGRVFVGDVRSLPHLEMFHTSVRIFQSPGDLSRTRLRRDIGRAMAQEPQLVVDPAFFRILPERIPAISGVRIALRNGRHHNELTKFRYDAILQVGERAAPPEVRDVLDWRADQLTLPGLRDHLIAHSPNACVVKRIPNGRLAVDAEAVELAHASDGPTTVAGLRDALMRVREAARVEPEELRALAADLGYDIHIGWGHDAELETCEVVLRRGGDGTQAARTTEPSAPETGTKPWSQYANRPVLAQAAKVLPQRLLAYLRERLPDYMVPSSVVILESLPLSPNGKVDRRALLPPDPARPHLAEPYVDPQDAVEEVVAGIWGNALGFDAIGRHDNFIELGGHSLLAIKIVARLQDVFPVEVSLRAFFAGSTVAALGAHIRDLGRAAGEDTLEVARQCLRARQRPDQRAPAGTSEPEDSSSPSSY